jgi:hypothetical protein
MKKLMTGIVFVACAFAMIGWGSTYSNKDDKDTKHLHEIDKGHPGDRDKGYEQADRAHQTNDEDIKRAQGDESGRRDIHDNKSHQDEEKNPQ